MARKSGLRNTIDDLSVLPWWLLLLTVPMANFGIKFGLPFIKPENPIIADLIPPLSRLAGYPL